MEVSKYLKKFKLLLEYVFEGKVVLNENTTEKLLKLLEDRSDNRLQGKRNKAPRPRPKVKEGTGGFLVSPGKLVLDTPCFSDLIFNSLESIHNATTSVKIFLFEIVTILFKNELQFAKIHGSIFTCILANLSTKNRGLNLASIKLATVQITHLSGLKLLLEHKVWQYILNDNTHRAPIKIANASYNFITKLILELNEYEMETELSEVLDYIVKPIISSSYHTLKIIDNETDTILSEKIYSYMYALLNVLKAMEDFPVNHVVQMLRSCFLVERSIFVIWKPLLMCANEIKPGRTQDEKQEFIEKFLTKIGKTLTDHIFTLCYTYKPVIETQDLTETAIWTIREMYRLKDHLTQTQAGLYFTALYHMLDIYILLDGAGGLIVNNNPIKTPNDMRLLSLVLDAIRMLLKDYNISWYENVEIASLQEGLMNLLKQDILNTKQIVQVLDLIDLCMKKFLSPNMTLLVESRQESTLTVIGAVMKTYMHHDDWEVRDSALNLLLSCTDLSFIKYIPLQKVISENNLMIYAAKAALTDPEYYVQSTGLKCLASATKIDSIWKEVLIDNPHIYFQLVYILRNNPEGMVRKEATKVLTSAYKNQKLLPTFQSTLYEVMISAALDDLHWEVQLAALQFFKHEIANQLSQRGMIDGKFPSVTFSKEKRKIITLNDKEILRQLTAIMHALSSIGCLTVLYECMNEMHHLEVMEQAYIMATELISILDQYKFVRIVDNALTYPMNSKNDDHDEEMALDLTIANNADAREKVIDSIVNTNQSELIMILHDNSFQTKSNEMEEDYSLCVQRKEIIHPNKFLETFKGTNFRAIIKEKKKWNSDVNHNLDGLLDEILDI
ncbi:unnamed protein product [Spodoptera exigua]|nr:unnamed protein product [Spodoptera exigua]